MEIHIQKRIHVSITSEQSKPILWTRPCGDIFTENHVSEPFSTNTEGVASSVALFPASTREQRSTYMLFYIKRFPLQRLHDFFQRAIEFVIWGTDFTAKDDWQFALQVYTLSSGVKPSFLKCDFRFSSALESSAYQHFQIPIRPGIRGPQVY